MISFLTSFKNFDEYYGPIQRSALFSYQVNGIPVFAPDMEPPTCEKNINFIKGIKTGKDLGFKNSTPVIKDMILGCLDHIQTPMVGFINSDIIIPADFQSIYKRVLKKYGESVFIAVTRYDFTLKEEINDLGKLGDAFKQDALIYDEASSSDLFIASKATFKKMAEEMPNFMLGRYAWDNWLHYYAAVHLHPLNGTYTFKTLHCRHTHQHIMDQEGSPGRKASSSAYNISLLKDMQDHYGSTIRINKWEFVTAP